MSNSDEYSHLRLVEFNAGDDFAGRAVTFTADGEHLLSGYEPNMLGVWRVNDGKQVATLRTGWCAQCVAASEDGRYIAAGTWNGELWVWDAKTYKVIFTGTKSSPVRGIDFSPDSTHLVTAERPPAIWDIAARCKVRVLPKWTFMFNQDDTEFAVRYSPQGDRIAAAGWKSIRVWDSNDARLLVDIQLEAELMRGLLWINDHLYVTMKGRKIRQINATTGSTVSEWSAPQLCPIIPHLALLHHGKFIAYSGTDTITFLETSTHTQLGLNRHINSIVSFSLSPDGQRIAMALGEKKIIVKMLPFITPETYIDSAVLDAWRRGKLTSAESLLTAAISTSQSAAHHVLAGRALVRSRLRQWDAALLDADESIKIQRSVIGYIAKCVALVSKGEMQQGLGACDTAFQHFRSDDDVSLLLLIKAVVLSMAREHVAAISRLDDLIAGAGVCPALYVIQANMHLLHGNLHMENGNYECAVQSFVEARLKLGERTHQPPLIITLITGWKCDDLGVAIQQRLSEALSALGRTKEVGESVSHTVDPESSEVGTALLHLSTRKLFTEV